MGQPVSHLPRRNQPASSGGCDIGHLSQTFHLACTAYQLSTWLTGAFYDDEIARRLALDPHHHGVMLMIGAGTGQGRAINQAILEALRTR